MLFLNKITIAWDQFFFTIAPTYNLAIFRIVWGTLIFMSVLAEIGNVQDFYGPDALVSLVHVQSRFRDPQLNLFNIFPESVNTAYGIYALTLLSLFMVAIGRWTRFFLFSSLVCLVSLNMRNVWLLSGMDVLIRCIFIILVWSPCANVLSLDSYMAKRKGKPLPKSAPQWTWRLIQIQLSVVYLWTFWAKFKGANWIEGSAVYYATRLETMRNLTIPWILDSRPILMLATWSTLIIECALGSLVWFKKLRTPVVILGILLHLGIEVAMAIPFFEWAMIVLLMNYYTPEEFVLFYQKIQKKLYQFISNLKLNESIKEKILKLIDDEINLA